MYASSFCVCVRVLIMYIENNNKNMDDDDGLMMTVEWLADRKGPKYRCNINGHEYIQTQRKPTKPRLLSEGDRAKRRVYMKNYRLAGRER